MGIVIGAAVKLRSLATTNLFILAIRLVQVFFSGCILGILSYYVKLRLAEGETAPSPYVFVIVTCCVSILTQFVYCFSFYHRLTFLWDVCVAAGYMLSLFWLLNYEEPLSCGWGSFNPFGSDTCVQTRSVLVMQIIESVLWFLTGFIGAYSLYRLSRKPGDFVSKV